MMYRILITLFFVIFTSAPAWSGDIAAADYKTIEVLIGQDKIEYFSFAPHTKVRNSNQSALEILLVPQKRNIIFSGLKPGNSTVLIRDTVGDIKAGFNVQVTQHSKSKIVKELKEFLGDIEGLEIGIKGDSVYVGGHIIVPNDSGRVAVVLAKYQDVLVLVELSPQTQVIIARKMQEEIQKAGMKDVTVRVVNGRYWLEGVVGSAGERARSILIAQHYLPDFIQKLGNRSGASSAVQGLEPIFPSITINEQQQPPPVPKLIKVTTQFVELTKDYFRTFGFKWNPFMGDNNGEVRFGKTVDGGVTTKSNGTLSAVINNLFPKLASAKSAGHARIIQQGVVITKDKVAAQISKRSEIPFAIGSGDLQAPAKAIAQFSVNVSPTILPEEKIDMRATVSVSSVAGSPPTTQTNTVTAQTVIKSKQSAALGGISVGRTTTSFDKNPPGGVDDAEDASPLFSFIRSKTYTQEKTQFVIFITPEIIESASDGTSEIRKKFRRRGR